MAMTNYLVIRRVTDESIKALIKKIESSGVSVSAEGIESKISKLAGNAATIYAERVTLDLEGLSDLQRSGFLYDSIAYPINPDGTLSVKDAVRGRLQQ